MKMIACHIENFGKICNRDFSFTEGMNTFCEENGWGKSTLATFIKVMLFGFANEGKQDKTVNERTHFKPWQGGVYGGSLSFSVEDKKYCVTRTFGLKQKDDTFELRDIATNLESSDYTMELGRELFKIDRESFERTVFLSQNDCVTSSTDDIHAKIGNLTDNTNDINNYENVVRKLADRLNKMSPRRSTGDIYRKKEEQAELAAQIRRGILIDQSMEQLTDRILDARKQKSMLLEEQAALQDKLTMLGTFKDLQARKEQYQNLVSQSAQAKADYEKARAAFPGEIPVSEEVEHEIQTAARLSATQKTADIYQLDSAQQKMLLNLQKVFSVQEPSDEEIQNLRKWSQELHLLEVNQNSGKLSPEEEKQLSDYQQRFADGLPSKEEIDSYIDSWNNRNEKENALSIQKANLMSLEREERRMEQEQAARQRIEASRRDKSKKSAILFLAIGAICSAAGVIVSFFQFYIGIILCVPGLIFLILGIMQAAGNRHAVYIDEPEEESGDELNRLRESILQDEKKIAEIEKAMTVFLNRNQINCAKGEMIGRLYQLKNQIDQFQGLLFKQEQYRKAHQEERTKKIREQMDEVLNQYLLSEEENLQGDALQYPEMIQKLVNRKRQYHELLESEHQYHSAEQEHRQLVDELREYLIRYEIVPENEDTLLVQLQNIQLSIQNAVRTMEQLKRAENAQKIFEEKNDMEKLSAYGEEPAESLEELTTLVNENTSRLNDVTEQVRQYEVQMEEQRQNREQVDEEEQRAEMLKEEIQSMQSQYKHLALTKEYLEKAKASFTAKYKDPILENFARYYEILTSKSAEHYHIDTNINLTEESLGQQRDVRLLSAGYQDLTGVCLRMALIDAMYQEEAPFLILDDPFTDLDALKIKGGMKLMKEISERYQILYFTCHESRLS